MQCDSGEIHEMVYYFSYCIKLGTQIPQFYQYIHAFLWHDFLCGGNVHQALYENPISSSPLKVPFAGCLFLK